MLDMTWLSREAEAYHNLAQHMLVQAGLHGPQESRHRHEIRRLCADLVVVRFNPLFAQDGAKCLHSSFVP